MSDQTYRRIDCCLTRQQWEALEDALALSPDANRPEFIRKALAARCSIFNVRFDPAFIRKGKHERNGKS